MARERNQGRATHPTGGSAPAACVRSPHGQDCAGVRLGSPALAGPSVRSLDVGNRVLVLAHHEPTLDPRVHYTAQSLAKKYAVTVLALVQESEARPAENEPADASYRTIRLPFVGLRWLAVPRAFFEIWLRTRMGDTRLATLVVPPLAFLTAVAVAALAFVFGIVVDLVALPFLLPSMLVNEPRLLVLPFGLKFVRKLLRALWP